MTSYENLIAAAMAVRERAYAPYSNFRVGAALLAADGSVFTGCNVENISYGLTICAERGAILAAVAAGQTTFEAIAIVAESVNPVSPCGACRQVMAEFTPGLQVVCANLKGGIFRATLEELLPRAKVGILDAC